MASVMPRQVFLRSGGPSDITLHINGEKHIVTDKFPVTTSLNDYLRDVAGLKGTKVMCNEAGCGCCAVTVTHKGGGDKLETFSINSCLCPLYCTDGWQISTVEGIGSQLEGFHPIQEKVAKYNATQCGYCTPGFVMSMYGLLHQNQTPTQQEIEDSFDGHVCRCTGYRPILDAMKTFASDATAPDAKCIDIEDLNKKLCVKTGEPCKSHCGLSRNQEQPLKIDLPEAKWLRPNSLKELSGFVKENKNSSIKLLFGNTASGIFKHEGPFQVYIDLHAVKELYQFTKATSKYVFGASTTLTKLKGHLITLSKEPGFAYCERVVKHLKVLASVLVRNAGCIAGNLMIKHAHPEFPSDLYTMMETIGASVNIYDLMKNKESKHSLEEFLHKVDMKHKVILSLDLPAFEDGVGYRSFKITPRSQNAHAYTNAAFKIPMSQGKISKRPSILYGGISTMTHAVKTEAFLTGKTLDYNLIKEALKVLSGEIAPTSDSLLSPTPEYRKNLAINLLYKTLLEFCPNLNSRVSSGAKNIDRPLSHALHSFQERPNEFPLKQPLPKKTAPLQASGEAVYTNDIPSFQHELFGAFVFASVGNATIDTVDPAPALEMPGVIRYVGAQDIPAGGVNNFMANNLMPLAAEEVFASSQVHYVGQTIGLILAENSKLAHEAAKKVKVTYKDEKPVLLDVKEAGEKKSFHDEPEIHVVAQPDEAMKKAHKVIEGEVREGSQYYFFLETQVAVSVPSEDGMDVYSATQFLDQCQSVAALLLAKPLNYFNMIGNRVGGSFGGKLLCAAVVGAASALAAYLTKRPVRIALDLSSGMQMFAPRFPILAKYKAGISADGKIEAIDADLYVDNGIQKSFLITEFSQMVDQGYHVPNWRLTTNNVKTNKPTSQACRGPGSVPAALVMESIMEHAAKAIDMHPIDFKEKHLYQKGQTDFRGHELGDGCTLQDMWQRLKQIAEVDARKKEVDTFNKSNAWKKRGITMTAVKYEIMYMPPGHSTNISVFVGDGTVTVMTTGVEIGQGLYIKVAQAVAATLEVPVDDVKVRPNQNNVTPNPGATGGSSTSEMCVNSAIAAANELKERMRPVKEKMPDADWKGLLRACYYSGLELSSRAKDTTVKGSVAYFTYCVGVAETEVDVLTGEYQIRRVDMMCDFGDSLNPTIDIGQAEGAYVMGLGAFLTEDIIYDNKGTVLNDGTWEYKPPTTKDIPIDWRVHFLPDSPNKAGVLSSKAVGEPPIGLSVGSLLAIKNAVESARKELTGQSDFIPVVAPYTVERIQLSTGTNATTATV